jgi:hypothetical protein
MGQPLTPLHLAARLKCRLVVDPCADARHATAQNKGGSTFNNVRCSTFNIQRSTFVEQNDGPNKNVLILRRDVVFFQLHFVCIGLVFVPISATSSFSSSSLQATLLFF